MALLSEEGLRGDLGNKYWEELFSFNEQTRKALYDYRIWPVEDFNLNDIKLLGGRLHWEEYGYIIIHKEEVFLRNWKGKTLEERKKGRKITGEIAKDICSNIIIKNKVKEKWALS
ncbi:hypothetical protein O181_042849 [Austropuccinia psidii MF-1]|uniref:Uncharacterized protein n=1 Tax=Austropuccinia psidii MF-1 TaxID=1389203 RepID=A0A9Q3DGW2_9BASI|nr:hypothetical protein [Austropuccinia psidii MF-1]